MKLEFLTGNMGLKILALILAIVLYHVVKQSSATNDSNDSNHTNERYFSQQAH